MNDVDYLQQALKLAEQSQEPVKCASILVGRDGAVVAQAYNSQRSDNLTAAHAEMKAIAAANHRLGRKLEGVIAYGNCEPCTMCLTALIFAKVDRIVFAKRLNDFVSDDQKIGIDCFEFVKQFPYQPKLALIEPVYRDDDHELLGHIAKNSAGWQALTLFGSVFAIAETKVAAERLVREKGLAVLAELWEYYDQGENTWLPCRIQEATPNRVRVQTTDQYGLADPTTAKAVILDKPAKQLRYNVAN